MERKLTMTTPTSLMRGIVVINEDPENRGRVKIRIPSYHGIPGQSRVNIADNDLPWSTPGSLLSAGNDVGQRIIPTVGTRIFVMFEDGDSSKPVYFGGIPLLIGEPKYYNTNDKTVLGTGELKITTDDTMSDIDYTKSQSSQGVLFKSLKGFTINYDDTDGSEMSRMVDQAGQMFQMKSVEPIKTRRGNKIGGVQAEMLLSSRNSSLKIGDIFDEFNGDTSYSEGFVFVLPSNMLGD